MSFNVKKLSPRISEIGFYRKGNWPEEELVRHIDDEDPDFLKSGHKCLLSVEPRNLQDYQTVYRQDYKKHWNEKKKIGMKQDLMERFVYNKVMRDNEKKANIDDRCLEVDYTTETQEKFNGAGFRSRLDVQELPVSIPARSITFWNENCKLIPKTKIGNDKSLKRSSPFSKPIQERLSEHDL